MELLRPDEVARILRLSKSKVYDLKEKIGYFKLDGAIRFRLEDVETFVLSCRVKGNGKRKAATRPRLRHINV